jgi:4-hydroxy-tetrahydrodipicolinate synthase
MTDTGTERRQDIFRGVGAALTTLFTGDLEVDYDATARHAQRLADAGVRAIVVCGTTGEPETLTEDEMLKLLEAVLDAVPPTTPVVMGASLPTAHQAVRFIERAGSHPVAAIIARSPRGVAHPVTFYRQLAEAALDTPLLAYHFPAAAPPGIPVTALPDLPVAGIKDSSGEADRLLATLSQFTGSVYVGSATMLLLAGHLGCAGAILQLANAYPELCASAFDGSATAQRELFAVHLQASARFPHGIKQLMADRFGTSIATRLG